METVLSAIQHLFPTVLRMSLSGSILVLIVVGLRFLFQKAPKWLHCLFWVPVGIRLLFPILPASPVSLMPTGDAGIVSESVLRHGMDQTLPSVEFETPRDRAINQAHEAAGQNVSVATSAAPSEYLPFLWVMGTGLMLLYAMVSTLLLHRKVSISLRQRGNIRVCDEAASPFILGILRPVIYLPSSLSEEEKRFVLAHERAHLRRLDHIWKPLGFLILSVHWFNPFCWLGYGLLCRDIELACDEKVIRELGRAERAAYSQTLLNCSAHRILAACPVAFGETDVKRRVKAVLNYKKPGFWILFTAILSGLALVLCFASDPPSGETERNPEPTAVPAEPERTPEPTTAQEVPEAIGGYERGYWAEVERELLSFARPEQADIYLFARFDTAIPEDALFGPLTLEDYIYGSDAWKFEYNGARLDNDPEASILLRDADGRTLRIMSDADALMIEELDGSVTWASYGNAPLDTVDMIRHLLPWAEGKYPAEEEDAARKAAEEQRVFPLLGHYTLAGMEPLQEEAGTSLPYWAEMTDSSINTGSLWATAYFGSEEMSADLRYARLFWDGDPARPMGERSFSLCRETFSASGRVTDLKVGAHDAFVTDISGLAGRRLVWYDAERDLLFSLVANHIRGDVSAGPFSVEELLALAESAAAQGT